MTWVSRGCWKRGWGEVFALAMVLMAQGVLAQAPEAPEPRGTSEPGLLEPAPGMYPPRVRLVLAGAATWRMVCARPGVESCAQFDSLPPEQRQGDTVDFRPRVPYLGVLAELELFPLARRPSPLVRGLGVALAWQQGFSRTRVRVSTPTGQTPLQEVYATDTALEAVAAWRHFFDLGSGGSPRWGHGGLRVGVRGRAFEARQEPGGPVPTVHRLFPVVGLDFSVPLLRVLRLEGGGHLFPQAVPGRWPDEGGGTLEAEVRDYGQSVSSLGWAADLGVSGTVWGPLGYVARFRLESYRDRFSGAGTRRGWATGGVAEEVFSSAWVGATVAW